MRRRAHVNSVSAHTSQQAERSVRICQLRNDRETSGSQERNVVANTLSRWEGSMMRSALLVAMLAALAPPAARAQGNQDWHRQIPGFKIAGNLYYVGTADLAVYLIITPQGNILINSDYKEDVPAIRKSIEGLGFKYADTKIILISHAHGDHDEGV